MKSGIYKIVCLANDKIYIGSAIDLNHRKKKHFKNLMENNSKLCNRHLLNAYNKYGLRNFEFHVLEYCDVEKLIEREQYYLDRIPFKLRFNIRMKCESNFGVKRSKSFKDNVSKTNRRLGLKPPNWNKGGILSPMYGKHHSSETKEKMSLNCSGENNPRAILSEMDVKNIRWLRENFGLKLKQLSFIYHSNKSVISNIINCKSWKKLNENN